MSTDKRAAISAIGAFVDDYVESYVLDGDECYHEPTEHERFLIEDAINGLVADDKFEELMAAPITAERDALRAEVESLTQQLKAGEPFHAVAVQQRDAAWREAESLRAEVERLTDVLYRNGFRRCDVPACNCGSWHHRFGLPERMAEIKSALADAGHPLSNDNGNLPLNALSGLVSERDALLDALTEVRDRLVQHPEYAQLTEDEEQEIGGDAAEFSYLARVATDAIDAARAAQEGKT